MASGMQTLIYPVKDLEGAKKVYTALLGTPPAYDSPVYIGWNIGGQDIGLDPNGHRQGLTAPLPYWLIDATCYGGCAAQRRPDLRAQHDVGIEHATSGATQVARPKAIAPCLERVMNLRHLAHLENRRRRTNLRPISG